MYVCKYMATTSIVALYPGVCACACACVCQQRIINTAMKRFRDLAGYYTSKLIEM